MYYLERHTDEQLYCPLLRPPLAMYRINAVTIVSNNEITGRNNESRSYSIKVRVGAS